MFAYQDNLQPTDVCLPRIMKELLPGIDCMKAFYHQASDWMKHTT